VRGEWHTWLAWGSGGLTWAAFNLDDMRARGKGRRRRAGATGNADPKLMASTEFAYRDRTTQR
jgi:hypothetical protein